MPQTLRGRARFGSFELDLRAGELHRDGQATVLQEQQFKVLLMLIERDGEIATRDEIRKKLWPNDTVVEFDHGINQAIKNLRRLLGDSAQNPHHIETIARRGYRLMVPVEWVDIAAGSLVTPSIDSPQIAGSGESGESDSEAPSNSKLKVGRLTGEIVSHYRVLEVIGGGGMGLVYRAEDLKLGRAVALKFLPEEVGDDPKARERFEREAKAVSALNHPNICSIYGFEEHEGHPFIVMELLRGRTLRDELAAGRFRLTKTEGLEIVIQIAAGLEAAHEEGIIHRDIKPANIFITEKNVAKILDFGVAKVLSAAENKRPDNSIGNCAPGEYEGWRDPSDEHDEDVGNLQLGQPVRRNNSRGMTNAPDAGRGKPEGVLHPNEAPAPSKETALTRTGMQLGTAGYMSPEQIRGERLDARTDIFSFGLILYEMATGERAFTGETEAVLHNAIEHHAPRPITEIAPNIAPRLVRAIARCLDKDRDRRFPTMWDLSNELVQLTGHAQPVLLSQVEKNQAERLYKRRRVFFAVSTLLIAGVVAGLFYRRWRATPRLTAQDTIVLANFENKTSDPIFTGTFNPALEVAFGQTPFFNPLSWEKVAQALESMNKSPRERPTAALAREVCLRTNSAAFLTGSIADAGNQYQIELMVVDCKSGQVLASAPMLVRDRVEIVAKLGDAAHQLRSSLKEPADLLRRYNTPLAEATTPSLEALHAYAMGLTSRDVLETIDQTKRAITWDPNFAFAYNDLGNSYQNLRQWGLSRQATEKAYQLRDRRLCRRDRFNVEGRYYQQVTFEFDKQIATAEQAIREFPRWGRPRNQLGAALNLLGEYEKAASALQEAVLLLPNSAAAYANLAASYIGLYRLPDASGVLAQAKARNLEIWQTHAYRYALGFLLNERQVMNEELKWGSENPRVADFLLKDESETEAYFGRVRSADALSGKAVAAAIQAEAPDRAADWKAMEALRSVRIGEKSKLQSLTEPAFLPDASMQSKEMAALTLARAGDVARAEQLEEQISQKYPLATLAQACDLPLIRAEIYLQQGSPASAIAALQRDVPCDLRYSAQFGMDSVYVRGEAYLRAGRAQEAANQFQKILDHPGIVRNSINRPLAQLQLARAQAMMGDTDAARKSYQGFLTLWREADPDTPIYKQAKAEYARLR